jgi:ribosome-binding protein aMBF1 (putative translation factor)
MSTPIEYQRIEYNGKPAYVLVPWEDWRRIKKIMDAQKAQTSGIPQAVVEAHVLRNESIIKAWREHLGMTQQDLAKRLGVSQSAVVKFERPEARPRIATIRKIALALGLDEKQLMAEEA